MTMCVCFEFLSVEWLMSEHCIHCSTSTNLSTGLQRFSSCQIWVLDDKKWCRASKSNFSLDNYKSHLASKLFNFWGYLVILQAILKYRFYCGLKQCVFNWFNLKPHCSVFRFNLMISLSLVFWCFGPYSPQHIVLLMPLLCWSVFLDLYVFFWSPITIFFHVCCLCGKHTK